MCIDGDARVKDLDTGALDTTTVQDLLQLWVAGCSSACRSGRGLGMDVSGALNSIRVLKSQGPHAIFYFHWRASPPRFPKIIGFQVL
jgi:hypothetical protein